MIVIDGLKTDLSIQNFANLEDLLVKVMAENRFDGRVVTDVLVNNESFSEIYPHQAEDIDSRDISSVEILTVPTSQMAVDVASELDKVVRLMSEGGRRVAELFRRAEDGEALELLQDLVEVTRDFLSTVGVLKEDFSSGRQTQFAKPLDDLSKLLGEMVEVMENEDWILLSDLIEYEFIPEVERWTPIVTEVRASIARLN